MQMKLAVLHDLCEKVFCLGVFGGRGHFFLFGGVCVCFVLISFLTAAKHLGKFFLVF